MVTMDHWIGPYVSVPMTLNDLKRFQFFRRIFVRTLVPVPFNREQP